MAKKNPSFSKHQSYAADKQYPKKSGITTIHNKRKRRKETYSSYIHKLLKIIHPESKLTISKPSVSILDSFLQDTFEKIATEAGKLCRYNKKSTMTQREIQTAVRLLIPGELGKHAVSEGSKVFLRNPAAYAKLSR
mmetsp:Transcript_3001/g.4618  ORF Transcript_3001/g.4618 Transcript_3001/m.4618 type:complete len:136 (+) Transcript_3001:58-465(+)|eukprot:6898905-Ditylum_brightwellii.AAC.1